MPDTKRMKKPRAIRILCVDDHPVVREGLKAIIETQPDMLLVDEVGDGEAGVKKYREHRPDVVLMDLKMPGMGGVDATVKIRKEFPDARIIVVTTFEGDEDIYRALEAGVQGYLLKATVRTELLQTIREVYAGRRHISPLAALQLAENIPRVELKERERRVLELVAQGLRNKEIATALEITEDTVKAHIKRIFGKLNVLDRTEAVVTASQRGIIDLEQTHKNIDRVGTNPVG